MYPCKNCGGSLKFDIKAQKCKCDYCKSLFDPYEIKDSNMANEVNLDFISYVCPQCGGEILTTEESINGFCSFCGATTMLNQSNVKHKMPEKIIPFKITKEECQEIYKRKTKRKPFLPKEYKNLEDIEKLRGIYIPYWLYEYKCDGHIEFLAKTSYQNDEEEVVETFKVSTNCNSDEKGISYDASAAFEDSISAAISPFNLDKMQNFTPSYLSGFYADRADVESETYYGESKKDAVWKMKRKIERETVLNEYSCEKLKDALEKITKEKEKPMLALFPIWFLSYRTKNNRVAYAVINGETGETAIDLPVDTKKYTIASLILTIPILFFISALFTLTPFVATICIIIMSIINIVIYNMDIKEINKKETRKDDLGYMGKYGENKDAKKYVQVNIMSIFAIVLPLIPIFINFVDDYMYYIFDIAAIVLIFLSLIKLIKKFNIYATRPFPNFLNRKGGDDGAK